MNQPKPVKKPSVNDQYNGVRKESVMVILKDSKSGKETKINI